MRALLLALLILFGTPTYADFAKGKKAYDNRDFVTALHEFKIAAKQGNADAMYHMGLLYDWGHGVPQDKKIMVKWYKSAAEHGHRMAQLNLGLLYHSGNAGVIQDYNEAIKWLNLAAEQGDSFAHWTLGEMYENGEGFPQDLIHAHMWFNIAASAGYDFGRENRDRISKKMNAQQIAEAQKLARECVEKNYKDC